MSYCVNIRTAIEVNPHLPCQISAVPYDAAHILAELLLKPMPEYYPAPGLHQVAQYKLK